MSGAIIPRERALHIAVVGVGLVGKEFMRQVLASRYPVELVGICNSRHMLLASGSPSAAPINPSTWKDSLASSTTPVNLSAVRDTLAHLVKDGKRAVLVDNTANEDVALAYPQFLDAGVHVVTPNKKAFSGEGSDYLRLIGAEGAGQQQAGGVERGRFLNESTVGAGLPIISTMKDLVETGDQVCPRSPFCGVRLVGRSLTMARAIGEEDRGRVLWHHELYLQ